MKLFRRMSALLMALLLVMSVSLSALAVDFDNMADGFAYDGEDTEVNITISTDVGVDYGEYYEAKEGKTYTIDSDNGSQVVDAEFGGSGSVEINTDVTYVYTYNEVEVTLNGDVNGKVGAYDESEVTVNGDVNGTDGNPDDVDYSDPSAFSDGSEALYASNDATVTVTGNVTGGDAYGTFGYAGDAVIAADNATVTVGGDVTGGNVTADPNTEAHMYDETNGDVSMAGNAITVYNAASVTVGGNATAGSTNGDHGVGGHGLIVYATDGGEAAPSVTVAGAVTAGKAENGTDGSGIEAYTVKGTAAPTITVGAYDTVGGLVYDPETNEMREMTEEDAASFITVTGIEESGEIVEPTGWDSHYGYLMQLIKVAEEGDEITTNIGARWYIPAAIIDAARNKNITLIIQWTGGEDLVITKDFTAELSGYVLIADLADMLKK